MTREMSTIHQTTTGASITLTAPDREGPRGVVLVLSGDNVAYSTILTPDAALDLSRHLRRAVMVAQGQGRDQDGDEDGDEGQGQDQDKGSGPRPIPTP